MAVVNGNIVESVRCLTAICTEEMNTESERLSAAETIANIPGVFSSEIFLLESEVKKVRETVLKIQCDPMTSTRGKIKAAQISIKIETLILNK